MKYKRYVILLSICSLFLLHIYIHIYSPASPATQTTVLPEETVEFPCEPDQRFAGADWYEIYAASVRSVRRPGPCAECDEKFSSAVYACARWWHHTPHRHYYNVPYREWSGLLRPTDQIVPPCEFGQLTVSQTKCSGKQRSLFQALDKLRVIYYPRAGTELGIIRGSAYIGKDGDIDLFVDMPPEMLFKKLKGILSPPPVLNRKSRTVKDPWVQWMVGGCPTVNTAYTDWIGDELRQKSSPSDLCRCRLNSVDLMCHAGASQRMYTHYGPSWDLALPLKSMDKPEWPVSYRNKLESWGWKEGLAKQVESLLNKTTGRIEAEAVKAFAEKPLGAERMALVLAQLNTFAARLADGGIIKIEHH